MRVQLIIDSASDYLKADADQQGILFMPLITTIDGVQYLDGVTLSHEEFYQKLDESASLPSTSQVPPYDYLQAYQKVRADGNEALVITISGKLSGTYESAVSAAQDFQDCVYIVDSENVSVGERILIEYALRLIDRGLDAASIAAELNEKKKHVCLVALLDTL